MAKLRHRNKRLFWHIASKYLEWGYYNNETKTGHVVYIHRVPYGRSPLYRRVIMNTAKAEKYFMLEASDIDSLCPESCPPMSMFHSCDHDTSCLAV